MRPTLLRSLVAALLLGLPLLAGEARALFGGVDYAKHVVALSVTYQTWNEDRPWAKNNPSRRVASAVVVEGPLLLTRAHIVADATLIHVERDGNSRPWPARVVHVDPEIDLALLDVEDPAFFDGLAPAAMARGVPTGGSVTSVRWNKRQLEAGNSRVSTVMVASNRYGNVEHHYLQVRTDLEGGGWAEPVFRGKALIGVTSSQESQRARVLPIEIIRAYLDRVGEPGGYRGFPHLDVVWQNNQDRALTDFLRFPGDPRGVLIRRTRRGGSSCGTLQERDILLSLDGHEIDATGNFDHPRYGKLRFTQIAIEGRRAGDRIPATVWRDGQEQAVTIELRTYPSEARLIPWRRDNRAPPYIVAGGLIFRLLDGAFLRTWGSSWDENGPTGLVTRYHLQTHGQTPEQRRLVIISSVLPDRYNLGYHDVSNIVVESVNGRSVDSIEDVAASFAASDDGFHVVRLEPNSERVELVLDATTYAEASERILTAYGVPQAMRASEIVLPELGGQCEAAP